ncbi:hypothetical protein HZF05_11700 [Sphingomonas sp. CGMCC 1.13654]|uniref:Uncharacterized protein n=1 Tax=Sphingomonas chungangi TaxID=2683589 RepID=A0A838L5Y8_9SPHN|nr:hypothetical protein [Sphingomonas chungangi]MBA2934761.1 hypothetical protein [Sphingomonas chungangi]MVW58072.1 hypothetical protein [Sphingomonas chungangi]
MDDTQREGRDLVGEVREAAARHKVSWGLLVPSPHVVDLGAEHIEEMAYQDMADAKRRLRDHICATYGITAAELCSLASL